MLAFLNIFSGMKLQFLIIGGGILLILLGSAYMYFDYTQKKIENLATENARLHNDVDVQHATIDKLQSAYAKSQKKLTELNSKYNKIDKSLVALRASIKLPIITNNNIVQVEHDSNFAINSSFKLINIATQSESF